MARTPWIGRILAKFHTLQCALKNPSACTLQYQEYPEKLPNPLHFSMGGLCQQELASEQVCLEFTETQQYGKILLSLIHCVFYRKMLPRGHHMHLCLLLLDHGTALGQTFAMNEIKVVIAMTLKKYELMEEPTMKPKIIPRVVLRSLNGIHIRIKDVK
uniref:Uncharacterized protein n=1 Tax=Tetraodon nigroviridis TaxID=99883 RepID=H3CBB6_TETNG